MTDKNYRAITLDWDPSGTSDGHRFWLVTVCVFIITAIVAVQISSIDVPKQERKQRAKVPDRVAEFIEKRPKPKPTPPPPPPPPPPKPKPKVARKVETAEDKKPLTVEEKQAREKASESGLLALTSELSDMIDTSDVDDLVAGSVKKGSGSTAKIVGHGTEKLLEGTGEGSGGVETGDYVAGVGGTRLSKREVALVKQSLFKEDAEGKISTAGTTSDKQRERTGNVRSEEEISLVFDQNKGTLYSIYNRERRKNPGLKGKIVLELTISPAGNVTKVRIVSSELNSPALEKRLLMRVKLFKFETKSVEPVTVVFPIEFLPS